MMACNALFTRTLPDIELATINTQNVVIDPILSSGFVKASVIVDVK